MSPGNDLPQQSAVSVDVLALRFWPDDETEFYFKRSGAVSREDAV